MSINILKKVMKFFSTVQWKHYRKHHTRSANKVMRLVPDHINWQHCVSPFHCRGSPTSHVASVWVASHWCQQVDCESMFCKVIFFFFFLAASLKWASRITSNGTQSSSVSNSETLTKLQQSYGDAALSRSQVFKKFKEFSTFSRAQESTEDEPWSGRLSASRNYKNVCWISRCRP